jgi:hypothetical protein
MELYDNFIPAFFKFTAGKFEEYQDKNGTTVTRLLHLFRRTTRQYHRTCSRVNSLTAFGNFAMTSRIYQIEDLPQGELPE